MAEKQKSVLLFDDDYESMVALKFYLEHKLGLQAELSAERTLLERLAVEQFDLICVDLMIHPVSLDALDEEVQNVHFEGVNWQKTGLEFLRRLRQGNFSQAEGSGTAPTVPVIVLSAVANYSVEDELGQEVAVEGYIEKPFSLEEMAEKIRTLLRE
jgi:CheY-like chemotaxis protein